MWHYPVVCITLLLLLLVGTGCYCRCWVAMLGVDEDDNNQIEAPVDVCVYIERERVREWCVFVYCPRPRSTKKAVRFANPRFISTRVSIRAHHQALGRPPVSRSTAARGTTTSPGPCTR